MSSLNELVRRWRDDLAKSESLGPDDVLELEQHLRSSVRELQGTGLSEEETFLVAASRLGSPTALQEEFGKVNVGLIWSRRIAWMLAGYVGLLLADDLLGGASSLAVWGAALVGAEPAVMATASLVVTFGGWLCILLWVSFLRHGQGRFLPYLGGRSAVALLAGVVALTLAAFAMRVAGSQALRLVSAEQFADCATAIWVGAVIHQVAVPVACVVVILVLRRRTQLAD